MFHRENDDTQIRRTTATPASAPDFAGEALAELNSSSGVGNCLRIANGTSAPSDFVVVGFVPQAYSGDPNGVQTSRCARDLCVDTVNFRMYYAAAALSTTWQVLM